MIRKMEVEYIMKLIQQNMMDNGLIIKEMDLEHIMKIIKKLKI